MNDPEKIKKGGDLVALGAAAVAWPTTATEWAALLSSVFACIWFIWRFYDRWKYGPKRGNDE